MYLSNGFQQPAFIILFLNLISFVIVKSFEYLALNINQIVQEINLCALFSSDTEKGTKHISEKVGKLEELQPVVHPGEPPPPGTETPGATELGQTSMDEGSYEVSPAHSMDLEDMADVKEDVEKASSEPKDAAVISRPPLLLGPESSDPTHTNHAPAAQGLPYREDVPNPRLSHPEIPAGNSIPEVAPPAESDRGVSDHNTGHHKEKEKKKKKDKVWQYRNIWFCLEDASSI